MPSARSTDAPCSSAEVPQGLGKLSGRVQSFLIGVLQERSQKIYCDALLGLKDDLADMGFAWAELAPDEQDNALCEVFMERYLASESPHRSTYVLAALPKIQPSYDFKCAK